MGLPLAPLPIVVPLLAAAAIAAGGHRVPRRLVDALALSAAAATAALAAVLLRATRAGVRVEWVGGWRPREGIAIGIALAVDPPGAALALLSAVLVAAALVFSLRFFEEAAPHLQALLLVFLAALCGFFLTGDLFDLFVFFELMSAAAFALAGLKVEEPDALQGALHFAVVNTVGAFLALLGLGLLYGRTGALNLAQIGASLGERPDGLVVAALALLAVGFLTKAAAVPFHFWLADAHAVAPTPVCVLFSGVMVEAGLYAVARLAATAFHAPLAAHAAALGAVLVGVGLLTSVVGSAMCFAQRHLKRLLAFSTIAHVGVMLSGLGVALASPAALGGVGLYALGHGLVKGALFLGAGLVLHRLRSVDEVALRGRGRRAWAAGAVLGVGGLALAGLPPFPPGLGEALVDGAARAAGHGLLPWALAAVPVVTGAAVLRAAGRIFLGWGPPQPDAPEVGGERTEAPETPPERSTPATMAGAALALLAAAFALGVVPGLSGAAREAGGRFLDGGSYGAAVLGGPGAPSAAAPGRDPAPLEVARHGLATSGAAVLLALAVLFRRRLPAAARRAAAAAWDPPIAALRRLHTGRVGDSVAWLTFGVAVLGGLAALALR